MEDKGKNIFVLILVLVISLLSGFFVYPGNAVSNKIPWKLGLDLIGGSALVYEVNLDDVNPEDKEETVAGLKEVIERRVNNFGVAEPKVATARKGDSYQLLVELAGVDMEDAQAQIGATPTLDFREVEISDEGEVTYVTTELTGKYLDRASLDFNTVTNEPTVLLHFNEEGSELFGDITSRNIGNQLAVFIDGQLETAPVVQQAITDGVAVITLGGGTDNKIDIAKSLVENFNAGALTAPIELINQRSVSASAASDALEKIIFAGLIGTVLVVLFMIGYYRSLGFVASFALLIYTVLTLALFKIIPNFTMTMAGIAGFVLSVGMAVDANILIFERTKEELKAGHSKAEAVKEGFKRAWTSIRDSNVATIITAVILYAFTSSFVKGFALTLGLGVLVSMFSAIFVTRTILKAFTKS